MLKILHRAPRHRITRHYSAELLTDKQTLTTSENSFEFTYGDFPCHLKGKRDKIALIYCLQKSKQGEKFTITVNSFTKIGLFDGFSRCGNPDEKIPPAPGTNQIAGFVEFGPLTS